MRDVISPPLQVQDQRVVLTYELEESRKTMHKYEIIIYWSQEDGVFIAEAPELPGCMANGPTSEAALKNVNDAIGLWIDTARKYGDPVPEPKVQRLMLA